MLRTCITVINTYLSINNGVPVVHNWWCGIFSRCRLSLVMKSSRPGGCCSIGYSSETLLNLKSREIQSLFRSCWIILKYCTERGSDTATLCAKFQNDSTTYMDVTGQQNLASFEFRMDDLHHNSPFFSRGLFIKRLGWYTCRQSI